MPTKYTLAITDGIGFEQFALRCARAMDACATLHDEPLGAPIPESLTVSSYYACELDQANAKLAQLQAMNHTDMEATLEEEYLAQVKAHAEIIAKCRVLRVKYETMLAQVHAWQPPTENHESLKVFMVQQLLVSLRSDCNEEYYQAHQPKRVTGADWLREEIYAVRRSIAGLLAMQAKEISDLKDSNDWLQALRASLNTTNESLNAPH